MSKEGRININLDKKIDIWTSRTFSYCFINYVLEAMWIKLWLRTKHRTEKPV